jgi:hypothetical protein
MNAKLMFMSALLIGSAASGLAFTAPAQAQSARCWAGYHADSMGNCQPDSPVVDDRCPPGLNTQVWPNGVGYICVPISRGY